MFQRIQNKRVKLLEDASDSSRVLVGSGAYTLLRMIVGVILTAHGVQKLLDLDAWQQQVASLGIPLPELTSLLALAGELLGGLGLLVGFLTPIAAFGVLATMVVAILTVHLSNGLFARIGGFEYPLTLACAALFFMFNGGGPLSIDGSFARWQADRRRMRTLPRATVPHDGHEVPIAEPELHNPARKPADEPHASTYSRHD
jgi:putative oxidoreductase